MTQALLFLVVHVLGVAVCLALGLGRGPAEGARQRGYLCAALGFPVGLAAVVGLELLMLGSSVPFTRVSGAIAVVLALVACAVRVTRSAGPPREVWAILLRWTLGFAIVATALTRYNFAILTYDSHYLIMMARIIAQDGSFAPGMLEHLGDYGIFQVLAHTLWIFTWEQFLWGLAPVFAASTIALFSVLLGQALDVLRVSFARRRLVVALVTAVTFSSYMLFRHSFYIQTNFGTAAYLFVFCALFWSSEVERSTSRLPVAFVALTAVALHRIEAPLVCVLFLSLAVAGSRLPRRALLIPLGGFTLAVVGWYALLASGVQADSDFLTPSRCYVLAGTTVALFAYAALSSWPRLAFLARVSRAVPTLVVVAFLLALMVTFSLRWDHMSTSAAGWLNCLWKAPYWEGTSVAIVALALLGLFAPAAPARWMFVVGIPAYAALILLLSWARTPYYWGMGDSAARMAIHLVPISFFYFALKFVPLLGATGAAQADERVAR